MSKPQILFVNHAGFTGGAELSLLDIAEHVRAHCEVVTFEKGLFNERLQERGVRQSVLKAQDAVQQVRRDGGWLQGLQSFPGVLRLVGALARKARAFDGIHANSQKGFVVSALAAPLARKPLIWHLRDILLPDHFSAHRVRLVVTLANLFARRVLTISQATADAFIAAGGKEELVRVVYNSIDSSPFVVPAEAERTRQREAMGWGEHPVVGIFSRIAPWKGQHVLIEALAELPHVHAVVVGAALLGDEKHYEEHLHQRIEELGLNDRVHLLGFRKDIPVLLNLVDVVVHTSVSPEPFGRVVVEGMLAQRPVIASRAGGVPEIIDEGVTGYLVPPGDAGALAQQVRYVLEHQAEAQRVAEAGRSMALKRFSLERLLREMSEHFDDVYR